VLEVIEIARRVTVRPIPSRFDAARPGDPPCLVADASKAQALLGLEARLARPGIHCRVGMGLALAHPDGYSAMRA
jgi:UDP-glucose 4-epimerase